MAEKPRECHARVGAVRALTPEILEAELVMVDPPRLPFEAGQWVSIPFEPKTVRAYSIASPPRSTSRITLAADVAPGGIGSRWFRGLAPGADVRFKGPLGGFVLSRDELRRPLFVAEEIGIVPIRSILMDLSDTEFGGPVTLVYWARHPGWLAYDAEFRALQERLPAFSYHPVVEEAGAGWAGAIGDVTASVDRLTANVEELVAYVAGGEMTIHRVRDMLVGKGLARKAVKWEKFW